MDPSLYSDALVASLASSRSVQQVAAEHCKSAPVT